VNDTQSNSGTGAAKAPDFSSAQQSGAMPGRPTPTGEVAPVPLFVPLSGWRKYMYSLSPTFGDKYRTTTRSRKDLKILDAKHAEGLADHAVFMTNLVNQAHAEALDIDHSMKLALKARLIERLRFLSNLGIQPIIVVSNIKSAGKSTYAIGIGETIAEYTRKNPLLIPSTANTATATAGLMAGVQGNLITVDDYMRDIKQYGAYRALESVVPRTKNGLGVIVEDSKSAADADDASKVKEFMHMIDVTLPNVTVLILDLGNDNISRRSIALQAARLGHVINFAFLMDNMVTHETLTRTVSGYNTDFGIPEEIEEELYKEFENKHATGLFVPTRDKVEHSIAVANKVPNSYPIDFSDFMRPKTQDATTADVPTWGGTGVSVPNEPSFSRKDAGGKLLPFDLDAISLDTQISYLQGAVANFEIAGFNTGFDIGEPMVAKLPTHNPKRRRELGNADSDS